uniref:Uncharacterized protein n=1 Tax=Plectus sambesii TaxID=2011161 RepID=A0A914W9D9_9BILA
MRRCFKGHHYTVNCLKTVGERLFSGSFDNSIRVWMLEDIRTAEDPYKFSKKKESKDGKIRSDSEGPRVKSAKSALKRKNSM